MPTFRVLRRVDAWIDYVAEIEAENAEAAAEAAHRESVPVAWKRVGEEEFWNSRYATLDEAGAEIAETLITRG